MDQHQMFCVIVEQEAGVAELCLISLNTTSMDGEVEFQIVRCQPSASRSQPGYHIHFTRPLVPTHSEAIEEEAIRFGLDPDELRRICAIDLQMVPENDGIHPTLPPAFRTH